MSIVEYDGQRVVTLVMIDEVHQRPEGTARKRFNDNKDRFIAGEDFWEISQPSEIRTLGLARIDGSTPQKIILFTESGYLMLVKSFTDDLAWQVQRQLVRSYFRATPAPQPATVIPPEAVTLYQTLTNVGMTAHGMTRKRAVTFANKAVVERYGIDFMGMMGIPKVGAPGRKRIERPTAEEADPKFSEVFANLAAVFGVSARPFSTAEIIAHPRASGDIARVLGYHVCDADGEISSRRLGRYLLKHSGEQVAGACVSPYGYTKDKVRLWAIDRFAQESAR